MTVVKRNLLDKIVVKHKTNQVNYPHLNFLRFKTLICSQNSQKEKHKY